MQLNSLEGMENLVQQTRTIMIFPEFDNIQIVNNIRTKYDPLADKVGPHITLVFPFESKLTADEISVLLEKALQGLKPFKIELQGISKSGFWLFLNIKSGIEIIKDIHEKLYSTSLSLYKPSWLKDYTPHITVGRCKTEEELENAFADIKIIDDSFCSSVSKISVEIIGANEESIIETEFVLK